MGKGYNNYMCKKPFHPGSKANIKRAWMAEQKTENEKRKQEDLKVQYEKEQDLYNNKALISSESKDKLELNFMYEAPPGAKREHQKEDDEPEFKFEWQRKYNAPREDYAKGNEDIKDQPFGIPVRNVRCIKCHKWGHINTDKECPLFHQASTSSMPTTSMDPMELMKQMKEDGFGLKEHVLGHQLNPAAANQQFIPSDESDPEMDFLKSLSTSDKKKLLKKLKKLSRKQEKSANCKKKKKSKKNKKHKAKGPVSSDSENDKKMKKKKKSKKSNSSSESESSSSDESLKEKSKVKHKHSDSGKNQLKKQKEKSEEIKETFHSKETGSSSEKSYAVQKKTSSSSEKSYEVQKKTGLNSEKSCEVQKNTGSSSEKSDEVQKKTSSSSEKSYEVQKKTSLNSEKNYEDYKSKGSKSKSVKEDSLKQSPHSESKTKDLSKVSLKEIKQEATETKHSMSSIKDNPKEETKSNLSGNSSAEEQDKLPLQKLVSKDIKQEDLAGTSKKRKSEKPESEESCSDKRKKTKCDHPDGFSHLCPQALIQENYLKPEKEYNGDIHDKFRHFNRDKRSPSVKQKYHQ